MKKYIKLIVLNGLLVVLASCGSAETTDVSEENETETATTPETAAPSDSAQMITCSGYVIVPPSQTLSEHAPVEGFVREIRVMQGQKVKKGQVLARLEHQNIIQRQENYLKLQADFTFISAEHQRKFELYEKKVISDKEYQEIDSKFQSVKISLQSMEKQLALMGISATSLKKNGITPYIEIRASSNGILTKIHANEGMFTSQDAALFELIDDTKKYVEFEVFTGDQSRITIGQSISFTTVGSTKEYTCKVAAVTQAMNKQKQSLLIISEALPVDTDLVVGSRVFGKI